MGILGDIFPMLGNWSDNKTIRKKIKENSREYEDLNAVNKASIIPVEKLKQEYDNGIEQKKVLEDKAKINVTGITIAISLIMGAESLTKSITSKFSSPILYWFVITFFVLAVFYMIFAGLMSIQVITNENQIETMPINIDESKEKEQYDCCISINNYRNLIRNNYIYSSYECIRNALICLFVVFLMLVFPFSEGADMSTFTSNSLECYYRGNTLPVIASDSSFIEAIENNIKAYLENNDETDYQKEIAIVVQNNKLFIKFMRLKDFVCITDIQEYEEVD